MFLGLDSNTLAFLSFFVGALIGVIVPALAKIDSTPAVQKGIQIFLTFMAVLTAAMTGGQVIVPVAFVGILLGYTFAMQANLNMKIRMLLKEVVVVK
jgi:hypothetical protein